MLKTQILWFLKLQNRNLVTADRKDLVTQMNEGIKFLRVGTARHFAKPEELAVHGNIFTEEIIQKVMFKDNSQF